MWVGRWPEAAPQLVGRSGQVKLASPTCSVLFCRILSHLLMHLARLPQFSVPVLLLLLPGPPPSSLAALS